MQSRGVAPGLSSLEGLLGTLCSSPWPRLELPARPRASNSLLAALTTSLPLLRFGAGTCRAKVSGLENMRNHPVLSPLFVPCNTACSPRATGPAHAASGYLPCTPVLRKGTRP